MKNIKYKKLANKLQNIEGELLTISSMVEIVRESCLYNDYTNQEIVLNLALKKQYELIERISLLY